MRCVAGGAFGVLALNRNVEDIVLAIAIESATIIATKAEPDSRPFVTVTFSARGSHVRS